MPTKKKPVKRMTTKQMKKTKGSGALTSSVGIGVGKRPGLPTAS